MHTILLIGSGRLSQHLVYWNSLCQEPNLLKTWNRKENSVGELESIAQEVEVVWLAISDSSILSFYEKNLAQLKIPIVHFSGSFHDERLISAHPLMSFPTEMMPDPIYSKIHFVLNGVQDLKKIMPQFKNTFSIINEKNKAFYHSLCVMAGNFPQLLWSETFPEFEKLNVPQIAIETYIQQITDNFLKLKLNSLTGPLIRKDFITIEKNLKSLENSKLKSIYECFVGVFAK